MKAYAQTTIHSKNSRMSKHNGEPSIGRLIKGSRLRISNSLDKHHYNIPEINQQLQKTSIKGLVQQNQQNQGYKIQVSNKINEDQFNKFANKTKVSQIESKKAKFEGQQLFDSSIFPAIYFKKITMRNILKQFSFPSNCKALPPNDQRAPLIYQIISNLFSQITFYIFNILVSYDPVTSYFYVFFSDSEIVPFTKCCNTPSYVQMQPNGSGRILCNEKKCSHSNLAEFLINYQDGKKVWKDITYSTNYPQKNVQLKQKISKSIKTGKYKNFRLKYLINQTTKQLNDAFQSSKGYQKKPLQQFEDSKLQNTFVTDLQVKEKRSNSTINHLNQQQVNQLLENDEKNNLELVKAKVVYATKLHKDLQKKLAKSIIDDSKVFHRKFQMSQKIDEVMKKTKNFNKTTTYLSFPHLMKQMRTKQQRRNRSVAQQTHL